MRSRDDGFSLVETAIVLFVLGALSGSVFGLVNAVTTASARSASTAEAREYLSSFADGIRAYGWPWGGACPAFGGAVPDVQVLVNELAAAGIPRPARPLTSPRVTRVEFGSSGEVPNWSTTCDGTSQAIRVELTIHSAQSASEVSAAHTSLTTIVPKA